MITTRIQFTSFVVFMKQMLNFVKINLSSNAGSYELCCEISEKLHVHASFGLVESLIVPGFAVALPR